MLAKDNISIITIKQQFLHTEASITDAMRGFSRLQERIAVYSYVNLMTIQTCTVWSKLNASNTINIHSKKSLATTCIAQTHATQAREMSRKSNQNKNHSSREKNKQIWYNYFKEFVTQI